MVTSAKTFHSSSSITAHTAMCMQLEGLLLRTETSPTAPAKAKLRSRVLRDLLMLALVLLAAIWSARAQSTFGSMRGTVADAAGAVIPGATVTAQSLDENGSRQTTTSNDGDFVFENLTAGHYKVTVHHDGFADAIVSTTLEARQELRLPVTLAIASQATTVQVQADGLAINTENGTVTNTVSSLDLAQLPMNSRAVSSSPLAGLALSPSVVSDSQGNIAVGGATSAQTGFSVDGISTANG